MPKPNLLEPPPPSLKTLAKKPHYIIVPTDEFKPEKKINSNIGKQNMVKGKRLKG